MVSLKKGTANAESVTLSFWVKSNKTGTYTVEWRDSDNNRHICASYVISSADTWEKKTITFAGDTVSPFVYDNSSCGNISFNLAVGSAFTSGTLATSWASRNIANLAAGQTVNLADAVNNYINITGVQLEVGTEATLFENRPYDMELARCQRYFVNALSGTNDAYGVFGMGQNNAATQIRALFTTPVQMRTVPSLIYSGNFQASGGAGVKNVTSFSTSNRTGNNFLELIVNTASGGSVGLTYMVRRNNDASAYLYLSAEL